MIEDSVFWVGKRPYCVWGDDIAKSNEAFIKGIDPDFYDYVALTHHRNLTKKRHRSRAALALKTHYHHGLECLFSLLCATVQAPWCVPGWIQRCDNKTLRETVSEITKGGFNRTLLDLPAVDWPSLSRLVHRYSNKDAARCADTSEKFSKLWIGFAADFLNQNEITEYNGIKHGLRVRSGGFGASIGMEHTFAVPPPREEMKLLVKSEFGTSHFVTEPIGPTGGGKRNPHYVLATYATNWDPTGIAIGLRLIALSINNIRSFLLIAHGAKPRSVKFNRPEDGGYFDKPRTHRPKLQYFNLRPVIDEKTIRLSTPAELEKILEAACHPPRDSEGKI